MQIELFSKRIKHEEEANTYQITTLFNNTPGPTGHSSSLSADGDHPEPHCLQISKLVATGQGDRTTTASFKSE